MLIFPALFLMSFILIVCYEGRFPGPGFMLQGLLADPVEILNIQDISSAENDVQFVEHISEGLLELAGFFSDLVLGPVPFAGVDYLVESVAGLVELVAKGEIDETTKSAVIGIGKTEENDSSNAKEYINKQTASDKLPKATTEQFGVVKVGQGLKISATGTLIATGEGVVADAVEWNNVINKPQPDEIENDQYYLTLINTLGTVARSNNYNDLNNKPDLSIYAEKSAIQNLYKLPVATTETLGGVKIDGKTITIKDGIIKAQDAGTKIKWRKWTE